MKRGDSSWIIALLNAALLAVILLPLFSMNNFCKLDEVDHIGACIREWTSMIGSIVTPLVIGIFTIKLQLGQTSEQKYNRRLFVIEKLRYEINFIRQIRSATSTVEFFFDDIYTPGIIFDNDLFNKSFGSIMEKFRSSLIERKDLVNFNIDQRIKESRKLIVVTAAKIAEDISDIMDYSSLIDHSKLSNLRERLVDSTHKENQKLIQLINSHNSLLISEIRKIETLIENDPL